MFEPGEDDYTNKIIMPGMLVETNAMEINGNELSWSIDLEDFFAKDYAMKAESRILNHKSIIVLSIFIIGIIVILLLFLLKKKDSA
jgi:hypothetical protein